MTASAFAAVLNSPECDASPRKLYELISSSDFSGPELPTVAESYLRAFCDREHSLLLRRWVGIALGGMMNTFPNILTRLEQLRPGLHELGQVIVDCAEKEEIKIVAGLLMRQAMEKGIKFESFWSSDKIRRSALNFPVEAGPEWLPEFQKFLDVLTDLKFMGCPIDLVITYAVSVWTSDGFRWSASSGGTPIVIIQESLLTLLGPDKQLQGIQFIDVPIQHIVQTTVQRSILHSSQTEKTDHNPYELIIKLASDQSTYRRDAFDCSGNVIKLLFRVFEDAQHCQLGIEECQKRKRSQKLGPHPYMSIKDPIDAGSSPKSQSVNLKRIKSPDLSAVSELQRPPNIIPDTSTHDCSTHDEDILQSRASMPTNTGKLSKVSKAAKAKALRPVYPRVDLRALQRTQAKRKRVTEDSRTSPLVKDSGQLQKERTQIKLQVAGPRAKVATNGRQMKTRRRMYSDDKDFVPNGIVNSKPDSCTKSAEGPRTDKGRPAKRLRCQPHVATQQQYLPEGKDHKLQSTNCDTDGSTQLPEINGIQGSSPISCRPGSLLGDSKVTNHWSAVVDQAFKRPNLPQESAHLPSTPCKVASKDNSNQRRIHMEDLSEPHGGSDSRPLASLELNLIDEANDGLVHNTSNTEILSSNSKPVPASPTAESTAISGHATRDDVESEQRLGAMQTSQQDPFKKCSDGRKITAFIRRLTRDMETTQDLSPSACLPDSRQGRNVKAPKARLPTAKTKDPVHLQLSCTRVGEGMRSQEPASRSNITERARKGSKEDTRADEDLMTAQNYASAHNSERSESPVRTLVRKLDTLLSTNQAPNDSSCERQDSNKRKRIDETSNAQLDDPDVPNKAATTISYHHTEVASAVKIMIDQAEEATEYGRIRSMSQSQGERFIDDQTRPITPFHGKTPITIRSSPPFLSSPSSHSSTSAADDDFVTSPIPKSSMAEMVWEASLQPHQRDLRDALLRVSDRVLLHVVDSETAVDDIVQEYARDGEHLLKLLHEKRETEYGAKIEEMQGAQEHLKTQLEKTLKDLREERERVGELV